MTKGLQKPAEDFKFGQGFAEDMFEIATRLGSTEDVMTEIGKITQAGASSLNAATFAEWGPEKTRAIFKVFITADNEAQPEIDKAWASPYPETEDEIEKQIYIFGLMESICRFIKAIRPAIMGNLGVTVVRNRKEITVPSDVFYVGKIEQNKRRKEGLERRLKFVKNAAQKPSDIEAEREKVRKAVQLGARSAVPSDKHLN